ncbi:Uncharacterized protein OBRU01_09252 [Operophtera brumata]|uniref:Transmembrane protein n=1 Tax=Operophtera brumata TaxID=104452 RepID=A0A0L7LG31_OPEBR|nr:Uncharacterized protein OBRU01_09252 [Operophtera brumata]
MFKQQLSPRSVHPYQTTLVPRSEQQFASAAQQRAKYPWAEDTTSPVYQVAGTDSSTSDNAYHGEKAKVHTRGSPSEAFTFPQCASAFSLPLCDEPQRLVSRSPMPTGSSVSPELPVVGACGGHCPGFEYVCYYILQVVFVVGVLTGISLCIAGIVLRRSNRNGDLGVLVYIGCLASCVCGVLLGVQCCVRRELRQRKARAPVHIPMHSIQVAAAIAFRAGRCRLGDAFAPRCRRRASNLPIGSGLNHPVQTLWG